MITQQKRRQQRKNRLKQISILNPCHINDLFIYIYKLSALYCKRFYLVVYSIYLLFAEDSYRQIKFISKYMYLGYMQKKRYFHKYANSNPLKFLEKKTPQNVVHAKYLLLTLVSFIFGGTCFNGFRENKMNQQN